MSEEAMMLEDGAAGEAAPLPSTGDPPPETGATGTEDIGELLFEESDAGEAAPAQAPAQPAQAQPAHTGDVELDTGAAAGEEAPQEPESAMSAAVERQLAALRQEREAWQKERAELLQRVERVETHSTEQEESRLKGEVKTLRTMRQRAVAQGEHDRVADLDVAIEERKEQLEERRLARLVRDAVGPQKGQEREREQRPQQQVSAEEVEHALRIQTWREAHSVDDATFARAAAQDDVLRRDPKWARVPMTQRWNESLKRARAVAAPKARPTAAPVSRGTQEPQRAGGAPQLPPQLEKMARQLRMTPEDYARMTRGGR